MARDAGPIAAPRSRTHSRAVGTWLLICCGLLFALIVVGGITRLTHSGLSITEWEPIVGILPPFDEGDWEEVFAKYQSTPEYMKVNRGLSVEQFKRIFWWEYAHRLLARALGAAFLVPMLGFLLRRSLDRALAFRLGGVFLLGAVQGAMGWYMVRSGLVDEPRVSHLRLTAHLGLALAIFAALFWLALGQLRGPGTAPARPRLGRIAGGAAIVVLVFAQALAGALVAGSRAGLLYDTFPLMDGRLVPSGLLRLEPWFDNLLYNLTTIQFVHRGLGWILLVAVLLAWWRSRATPRGSSERLAASLLAGVTMLQFALGVATLLGHVPLRLAILHQAGAVLLLTAALAGLDSSFRSPSTPPGAPSA